MLGFYMPTASEKVKTIGGLSLKEEAFARHWVLTRNDVASYKKAGYSIMEAESMRVQAYQVRTRESVAKRILEFMANAFKHAKITPKMIEEKLWEEASLAESDGARATNLKTLGQVHAMLTQKHEVEEHSLTDHDLAMSIAGADYENPPETVEDLDKRDAEGYNWVITKLSS